MNFNNEQMLIGALITKPDNFFSVSELVTFDDFTSRPAGLCFNAIRDLIGSKQPVNIVSVVQSVGSAFAVWVSESTDFPGAVASIQHIAEKVADQARARRIEQRMAVVGNTLRDFGPDMALQEIQQIYRDETGGKVKCSDIGSVSERFKAVVAENRKRGHVGVGTGFHNLEKDHVTYQQGHLWVIGAWTSTGKTAWCVEALKRVFRHDNPTVLVFSTEMTEEQNLARLLANVSLVSSHKILGGNLDREMADHVGSNLQWVESKNLFLYDQIRNVDQIGNQARKIAMQNGKVDLIFIDFIQNIAKKGCGSKYEMMSEIAIDLQSLAKELRCCIVCLSQIPTTAAKEDAGILEFKGAGEIAAAADLGVLLKKEKKP